MGITEPQFESLWTSMIQVHGKTHNVKKPGYALRLKDLNYDIVKGCVDYLLDTSDNFPKVSQIKRMYLERHNTKTNMAKVSKRLATDCPDCHGAGQITYWHYRSVAGTVGRPYSHVAHCLCEAGQASLKEFPYLPLLDNVLTEQNKLPKGHIQFASDLGADGLPQTPPDIAAELAKNKDAS